MKRILAIFLTALCLVAPIFAQAQLETSTTDEDLRIVSLAPNVTEIIYALGAGDALVGRTDYCNYPEQAVDVPSIGTLWEPNLELVVSLEPTIAIASSIVDPSFIESLNKAGIKAVQILKEESLDGTFELIQEVGDAIGRTNEAKELVASMKDRIDAVTEITSKIPEDQKKSAVYIISWGDWGDYVATGDTYLEGVLEAAGAVNAAKDATSWSISKELLISQDPDVVLLPRYSYSDSEADILAFTTTEPYSKLGASVNSHVYAINGDAAERQGVRTADTIEEIAKLLYPELF